MRKWFAAPLLAFMLVFGALGCETEEYEEDEIEMEEEEEEYEDD